MDYNNGYVFTIIENLNQKFKDEDEDDRWQMTDEGEDEDFKF